MFRRLSLLCALGFGLASAVTLMGCGDDPPKAPSRRRSKSKKKKKKEAKGIDLSKLPPKLRNIDWTADSSIARSDKRSRDPFRPFVDDIVAQMEAANQLAANETAARANKRRVGAFNVEELKLMAIVTGTAVPNAMLTDPSGLGHVIRAGDVVGRDVPYRVTRITRNEVVFRPLQPPTDKNQPTEIRKALLSRPELEEIIP